VNHKRLILRLHELWNTGDVGPIAEVYADDFVAHFPPTSELPERRGLDGVRQGISRIRSAFPDWHEEVEDLVEEGDRVVSRYTSRGTHRGAFWGVSPTGRRITVAEISIFRVAGGKAAEQWCLVDELARMYQLGAVLERPGEATPPALELLYEVAMDADVQDLGPTPAGHRRIVVVKGGRFEGPRLRGDVLPGGGDWLVERSDGSRRLDVRLTLRTDDGHLIYATYGGLFRGAPDVMRRILGGEPVEPSEYYFRVVPLFETASEKYRWLNGIVAIGVGRRTQTQVAYTVYTVR